MKKSANWHAGAWALLIALAVLVAAIGCGGSGGGSLGLDPSSNGSGAGASAAVKSAGVLVTEAEIPSLPAWQQELLSDPGWNQPYIEPVPGTEIEAPTDELLWELTERELAKGLQMAPRLFDEGSSSKGVSWNDQGNFNESMSVSRAEYESYNGTGTPPWGCNVNTTNDYNTKNKASEDAILGYDYAGPPQRISFVLRGTAANNWFTSGSSTGNNATNCVYQLYSSDEGADPTDPNSTAMFAEVSYRADKAIDPGTGLPGEPGGECPDAEAFMVDGLFWKKFNSTFSALPNYAQTALYNILIAPQSDESDEEKSSGDTMGSYQEFYLGSQTLYNGAWIVGLASSTGGCTEWQDTLGVGAHTGFFHNPIFGVLLARWQDAAMPGMAGPWEGTLGWPVFGPQPLSGGSTLTAHGAYYAWGMWFERGFIWWVDYNQTTNPDTPDEAQMYLYTGSNVYCKDGTYEPTGTLYYGGTGPLAVNVSVDGMRYDGADPWEPVPFNESLSRYEITLENQGLDTVTLAMHAQAYGGVPNVDGLYKYYVWAFRDGTIQAAGPAYSDFSKYVTHTYGSETQNLQGTYVVRCQVTDASMDMGYTPNEVYAYGDSFPIVLGARPGSADLIIIRDDQGAGSTVTTGPYNTNLNAMTADLDEINNVYPGFGYSVIDFNPATFASDISGAKGVIWYRGGPGTPSEPYLNDQFSDAELAAIESMQGSTPYTLFCQNIANYGNPAYDSPQYWYYYDTAGTNYWSNAWGDQVRPSSGYYNIESNYCRAILGYNTYLYNGSTYDRGTPCSHGWGNYSANSYACGYSYSSSYTGDMGVFYSGVGSSGKFYDDTSYPYQAFSVTLGAQCSYWYSSQYPINGSTYREGATYVGNSRTVTTGNSNANYNCYFVGYPWAQFQPLSGTPSTPARWEVMQNIVASMDPTMLDEDLVTWEEYSGQPEILSVTPLYFDGTGALVKGFTTPTYSAPVGYGGGAYPDQTGTNVYKTFDPGDANDVASRADVNQAYVWTADPNNDWVNGNDVDFQFPWYAYVQDVDGSLVTGVVSGDEILIGYGGLAVEDLDDVWQRDGIVSWDDRDFIDVALWLEADIRPVAGYYRTALDVDATPALDTAVKASYGSDPASLTWDNQYPLMAEAVAHWDNGDLLVPTMQWAMFPGHSMIVNGDQFPSPSAFIYDEIMSGFDIDPWATVPGRTTGSFNRSIFTQLATDYGGRYAQWDFQTSSGNWYGDFNLDGVFNVLDKFPVRCRLLVDNGLPAPGVWPDHMYDPGSAPAGGVTASDGFYVEGGCYVIDQGAEVKFLTLLDDPAVDDPYMNTVYLTGTSPKEYDVTLGYILDSVFNPTDIELDANYDGVTFGSDPTQVYTVRTGVTADGAYGDVVTITQDTVGLFNFALRASDGMQNYVYWYPDQVVLAGYAASSPWLVVADGDATGSAALEANLNAIAPDTTLPPGTVADTLDSSAAILNLSAAACYGVFSQYDYVFWNTGGTGASIDLTDDQAAGASQAMTIDDTVFFYFDNYIATSSAAGSSTQQAFARNVSGMNAGTTPGTWNDTIVALPPITAGPGGPIGAVSGTLNYSDCYSSLFNTSTSVSWGQQGGWSGYRTISLNDPGLGAGVWVAAKWSDISVQQPLLHNMLFYFDPVTYPMASPPDLVVPWTENFDDGVLDGWATSGSGMSWIAGAPTSGTYPAQSSPYVARLDTQPYNYNGGSASMILDDNGRTITTAGDYNVTMYVNGATESGWDYLYVRYYLNGSIVNTQSFTGYIASSPMMINYSYNGLSAGDFINIELYFDADIFNDYGPQVDSITIDSYTPPPTVWSEDFESGLGGWSVRDRQYASSGVNWWTNGRNNPGDSLWSNITFNPWIAGAPALSTYPAHSGSNVARLTTMNNYLAWSSNRAVTDATLSSGYTVATTGNYYVGFYWNGDVENSSYDPPAVQVLVNGTENAGWKPDSSSTPAGWPSIVTGYHPSPVTTPTMMQQTVSLTAGDVVTFRFWFACDSSVQYYGPQYDDFFIQGPL